MQVNYVAAVHKPGYSFHSPLLCTADVEGKGCEVSPCVLLIGISDDLHFC